MITLINLILAVLLCYATEQISGIIWSKLCAKICNYNCNNCKMWSCTYGTDHENYKIPPYDNFYNVCGKEKRECMKK